MDQKAAAKLYALFQTELGEHCQALTHAFLQLEKEPSADEAAQLLASAFRAAHSLKGAARAMGFTSTEALANGLEGILGAVRQGSLHLTPTLFDLLYATVDTLSDAVADPTLSQTETASLLSALDAAQQHGQEAIPPKHSQETAPRSMLRRQALRSMLRRQYLRSMVREQSLLCTIHCVPRRRRSWSLLLLLQA